MKKAELYFGSFLLLIAVSMFSISFTYPYHTKFGPGPGFFPAWVSGLMILTTTIFLIKKVKEQKHGEGDFFNSKEGRKQLGIFIIALICSLILLPFLGFFIACGGFALFILKYVEKYSWKSSSIVSVCTIIAVFIIFDWWLHLPLPKGFLLN